ncbi:MAG: dihydropteroate synthase DHPS [Actinobacteria bacterium]|nr:MAG: dihydropteroate synthase DHPS [Actinomycetota bacterium]
MLLIGEKINVMSKTIGPAMKERNPEPIVELAKEQIEAGANMLDLNVGPATKKGDEMMAWLVETVQGAVDVPLCLDTTNPVAMEAGLAAHKGQAMINSTSGDPERMQTMMPLAAQYNAKLIGLALTEKGIPRDANERMSVAVDIMTGCMEHGVDLENLYLDPLVLSITVPGAQYQAMEVVESIKMFRQLNDPPLKTVVGLSNISNGALPETKPLLDSVFLTMLLDAGLDAAIVDPFEAELMNTMKTIRVLGNETVYCHSYLELC